MPLQFFLTKNPTVLAEYFELRGRVYRRHYPSLTEDFGRAEAADDQSLILVGYEDRVVAGGRITISTPAKPQPMPMEEAGFRLAAALEGVGRSFRLDEQPYAEFSRVAVDPDYAGGRRCGLGLICALAHAAASLGVDLVFSMCPEPMVRLNEINSRKVGVTFHPFPEIAVPNPFGMHMILCAYTGLIGADHGALGLTA
ncbi:MAG: hypothetical protein JO307_30240 [Bryobacterales bacterium]|nr:hypothetical protein [Bryobacterales bacterium]MBV9400417.1 hypothetical protein [Bryobacterales bacterium]